MSEEINPPNEYDIAEPAETDISEIKGILDEESKIDNDIYGKRKPRREIIARKIVHDEESR